jgi:Transposase IS116/IS110/IS902 family
MSGSKESQMRDEALARADENCRRLMTVPGIGPIIASAMVAAIGNGAAFAKGRDFAAWLGLVPKQMSTGDRTILGRITKRGNCSYKAPAPSARDHAFFCTANIGTPVYETHGISFTNGPTSNRRSGPTILMSALSTVGSYKQVS